MITPPFELISKLDNITKYAGRCNLVAFKKAKILKLDDVLIFHANSIFNKSNNRKNCF